MHLAAAHGTAAAKKKKKKKKNKNTGGGAPTGGRWLPSSALTYGAISSIQASISVSQPIRSQRGSLIRSQDRIVSSLLYVCGAQARPASAMQALLRIFVRGNGWAARAVAPRCAHGRHELRARAQASPAGLARRARRA